MTSTECVDCGDICSHHTVWLNERSLFPIVQVSPFADTTILCLIKHRLTPPVPLDHRKDFEYMRKRETWLTAIAQRVLSGLQWNRSSPINCIRKYRYHHSRATCLGTSHRRDREYLGRMFRKPYFGRTCLTHVYHHYDELARAASLQCHCSLHARRLPWSLYIRGHHYHTRLRSESNSSELS